MALKLRISTELKKTTTYFSCKIYISIKFSNGEKFSTLIYFCLKINAVRLQFSLTKTRQMRTVIYNVKF